MPLIGLRFKVRSRGTVVIALAFIFAVFGWEMEAGNYYASHLARAADASNPRPSATQSGNLPDFVSLVKKIGPSVVNIATTQVRRPAQGSPAPFGGDQRFNEFWERFFGGQLPRSPQRQRGLGSGFIIDSDGTIITNHHVVDGAEKIVVTLADGKSFDAKVLGSDQKSDIAIVKIDANQRLTAAALGDSDQLDVGEWVMAIGNPFGLDNTVTTGIVSAKGRHIGAGPYDSFIQTDASINPGNSGGPLVNLRGEVVGINTAIFSQSGGNIGIGFAIPVNLARELVPQLKDNGKIVRGYLGVTIQKVTADIAATMGLKNEGGALVAEVAEGGPAERSGIKAGDVIVEFNGKLIKDSVELPLEVARVAPGKTVQVKILRDSKQSSIAVQIDQLKDSEVVAESRQDDFGMTVQPVTSAIAQSLGLERAEGLLVSSVQPGSAADEAGLRRGDVITQINRSTVRDLADYKREIARAEGKSILFLVKRDKGSLFLALKP
ncbi:MAG TPA: DegQ family serine endoprotease [Candidatus Binatia bacterium]